MRIEKKSDRRASIYMPVAPSAKWRVLGVFLFCFTFRLSKEEDPTRVAVRLHEYTYERIVLTID